MLLPYIGALALASVAASGVKVVGTGDLQLIERFGKVGSPNIHLRVCAFVWCV